MSKMGGGAYVRGFNGHDEHDPAGCGDVQECNDVHDTDDVENEEASTCLLDVHLEHDK